MSRYRPNAPPHRNGVSASCVVVPPGMGPTVLDFLDQRYAFLGRDAWMQRLLAGDVMDAMGRTLAAHDPAPAGLRLYYFRSVPSEAPLPFEASVLWENAHLLVADKPHFLPVIPSGKYLHETLLVRLKQSTGIDTLSPIHRIDRDTAGLVLFAKQPSDRAPYQALFRARQVDKVYECIAPWNPELPWPLTRTSRLAPAEHFMQQREVPGPPNAITQIEPIAVHEKLARYRLHPITGQRHQLRVHMAALGLPIVGDGIYPVLTAEGSADFTRPLQLLARSLALTDPLTGQRLAWESRQSLADWDDPALR